MQRIHLITTCLALGGALTVACSSDDSSPDNDDGTVSNTGGFMNDFMQDPDPNPGAGAGSNMNTGGGNMVDPGTGGMGGNPMMSTGGMTGEMGGMGGTDPGVDPDPTKPTLVPTLDDNEDYNDASVPDGVSLWGRWDPTADISTVVANSGTKSIRLLDDTGGDTGDAPEIRQSFEAASQGVFQTSLYIVPSALTERKLLFTLYGDDTASANILADVRFDEDVDVDMRDALGDFANTNTSSFALASETWLDVEIAWNTALGDNGSLWITVDGTTVGPLDLLDKTRGAPQALVIKMGDNSKMDTTAAAYLDDIGLATQP